MERKIVWYPLFLITMVILYVVAFFKNVATATRNLFHKTKKKYWSPSDWMKGMDHMSDRGRFMAREDYDPTESCWHE